MNVYTIDKLNKKSMMKRVVVLLKEREPGVVEAWHDADDEAHFGDAFLKTSRDGRGWPRYKVEWFFH